MKHNIKGIKVMQNLCNTVKKTAVASQQAGGFSKSAEESALASSNLHNESTWSKKKCKFAVCIVRVVTA